MTMAFVVEADIAAIDPSMMIGLAWLQLAQPSLDGDANHALVGEPAFAFVDVPLCDGGLERNHLYLPVTDAHSFPPSNLAVEPPGAGLVEPARANLALRFLVPVDIFIAFAIQVKRMAQPAVGVAGALAQAGADRVGH